MFLRAARAIAPRATTGAAFGGVALALFATASAASDEAPKVTLSLLREYHEIGDELLLRASFRNATQDPMLVREVKLEDPFACVDEIPAPQDRFDLEGDAEFPVEFEVEASTVCWKSLRYYSGRSHSLRLKFEYAKYGEAPEWRAGSAELPAVTASGTTWAVALGGIAGVLLLFSIEGLGGRGTSNSARRLRDMAYTSVAVLIAIVIFRFSANELPVLPIAVDVKDAYGGLLLGLMGRSVARWLRKLLGGRELA